VGQDELIASLFREADEKAGALWEAARAEAEEVRRRGRERLSRLKEDISRAGSGAGGEEAAEVLMKADEEARRLRLESEHEISERLHRAALESLQSLRGGDYPARFRAMAAELPPFDWKKVSVNPADEALAREVFPGAEVRADAGIAGGFEAETADGKVRVVDTFLKRLERAWPELLPELMRSAGEAAREGDGTA